MRLTTDFLQESGQCDDCEKTLEWLAERAGFCDCEVLLNIQPPDDGDAIWASTRAHKRIIEAVHEYEKARKRMG